MRKPIFSPDPRARIIALVMSIASILTIFFPSAFWKAGIFFLCLLIGFCLLSPDWLRSFRNFLRINSFLLSFLLFLAAVKIFFSTEPFSKRLENYFDLALKTYLILISTFIFILDRDFPDLIKGFYLFRLPSGFLAMLTFAYRYSVIMREELFSIFRARISRTIKRRSWLEEMKITGLCLSQYLFRLIERSERIYAALLSRGFQDKLDFLINFRLRWSDILFLFLFGTVLAAIKLL